MAEEMTVKIRSLDGSPILVDQLAKQIKQAGCEIVSVPVTGTRVHVERPSTGWPPMKMRYSTAPDLAPEVG